MLASEFSKSGKMKKLFIVLIIAFIALFKNYAQAPDTPDEKSVPVKAGTIRGAINDSVSSGAIEYATVVPPA
jgi:hypothetical protein